MISKFFKGSQTVSLNLLVKTLSSMMQNQQSELKDLTLALELVLCGCAKHSNSVSDLPDRAVFNKASALGLDDYLGYDIDSSISKAETYKALDAETGS